MINLDKEWREIIARTNLLKKEMNKIQKEVVGPAKKAKLDCTEALTQIAEIKTNIKANDDELPILEAKITKALNKIGNIVDAEVPISKNEDEDSLVVTLYHQPEGVSLPAAVKDLSYTLPEKKPLTHDDLLWRIDGYEPLRGQGVAGHRAYFLKNNGVLLNQALIQFGITHLRQRGYEVLQPPYFMNKDVMAGIAQLDDDTMCEDIEWFATEQERDDNF